MDSLEPTPPKVRRINKHAAMHVSECVREFKLPVHFPGLVSGHKPVSKEHTITPSMTVLKTIETEPQTIDVGKKISKGKNVQLVECTDKKVIHQISSDKVLSGTNRSLSSPNSSKIKTLTNPMSNSLAINYNGVSKLKTLKLKSPDGKDLGEFQVELLDFKNQVQKRKLITIPTSALTSKDDSDNIVTSTQNDPIVSYSMKDVQYPGSIYQEPRIDKLENDLSSKVKIISNVSLNKLPADDLSKIIQGKQMIKTIFSNTPFEPPTISTKHLHPTDENSKKLLYLKPEEHPYLKSITKTGKPISLKPVKLKSLTLNLKPSEINDPNFTSGLSGYKNGDMDEDCEDELENEKIDSPKNESEQQQPKREWKKLEYTLTKKNVMVMLPKVSSNKKLMTNRRQSSESSLTTSEEDFTNLESDSPKQGKLSKSAKGKNSDKKRKENSEDVEFNQSVDISIVERALASVKDKTLRDEALKILASCKLGIERQIPIRPPSNEISVRDTTTQTDIFGNLERECEEFIEVKKSEKGIKRINKIMRDGTIAFKSLNSIVNPIKQYEEENNFSSQLDKMIMELDIDSNDKQEMTKIKNVLERPIQSVEKMNRVQMQIINDIKSLEICDEDGFTGLHKAIVRDDIKAVKRLLMILPMTKNNIDAKSYDNKTSLELAMKMDADPEIVNCLLEAGAKPTSEEVGYDSALLIACKNSSPLLPQLIKYACKTALDSMDVEGFGAIHICAVRGNSNAINSLIAAGANINLQDLRSGRTALFHAIENGHIDLARHLLASGAKPSIRNNDGHTILPLLDDPKTQILKNIVLKAMKSH